MMPYIIDFSRSHNTKNIDDRLIKYSKCTNNDSKQIIWMAQYQDYITMFENMKKMLQNYHTLPNGTIELLWDHMGVDSQILIDNIISELHKNKLYNTTYKSPGRSLLQYFTKFRDKPPKEYILRKYSNLNKLNKKLKNII